MSSTFSNRKRLGIAVAGDVIFRLGKGDGEATCTDTCSESRQTEVDKENTKHILGINKQKHHLQ